MTYTKLSVKLALFTAVSALTHTASAQAAPAATQRLQLSAFVAATGTFTGLEGGKNLGITAGADLTYLGFRQFLPSFEVRGTYPIDQGHISSQKNFLLGPKVEYPLGKFHPYADFLIGRGQIDYHSPGFVFGDTLYISSNTLVYSPGVGLDYNVTHNIAIKADAQFQHWDTPVTTSGTIHPTALSVGVVYNFDFNSRHRHNQ
ncbi:MAG TPA: outer membrane beta-barrel protein [Edaphobacter sp.]|jgi:opacity protein-like surface antigen|nr:outer membrane beta-barrel protein [Edaphobacter sp.]